MEPRPYDHDAEDIEYCRSLMEYDEREKLDEEIKRDGFLTIDKVRSIIAENTIKGSLETGTIDADLLMLIDVRIDYKIFIVDGDIYTRDELIKHYPFDEFGIIPESVFANQEIVVYPADEHFGGSQYKYIARDAGDKSECVTVEDMIGATRKGYVQKKFPLRTVKTKIYAAREKWTDFMLLKKIFVGAANIASAQIEYGGEVSPMIKMIAGCCPKMIQQPSKRENELIATQARLEEKINRMEQLLNRNLDTITASHVDPPTPTDDPQ